MIAVVGFYRTGTHWLCMLIQEYFGHPVEGRAFFEHYQVLQSPAWGFIDHDIRGDFVPPHQAVYIYRDPVDVIFSLSRTYKGWEPTPATVRENAELYGVQLGRWLTPGYTEHVAVVRYERMREDFPRVCLLVHREFDASRFDRVFAIATKERVTQSRGQSPWLARPDSDLEYAQARAGFRSEYAGLVWDTVLAERRWLLLHFDHLPEKKQWQKQSTM